jgi:segregation and condensation protein B
MIMRNTMDNGRAVGEPYREPGEADRERDQADLERDQADPEPDQDEAREPERDEAREPDQADLDLGEPARERDQADEADLDPGEVPAPAPGLRMSLEAVLLVADEPVSTELLADVTGQPEAGVAAALRDLAGEYTAQERGFDLREVAGGWRLYTRDECAAVVERFVTDGQEIRLTQAALETLAVVAYRQPVSRARVSAVRGVNCDGVMRTLVLRGLVEEAGSDPETGAILFQTTSYFLERLGLARLSDLPDLTPFLPDHLDEDLDFGHDAVR